jgi:hypothetical protein
MLKDSLRRSKLNVASRREGHDWRLVPARFKQAQAYFRHVHMGDHGWVEAHAGQHVAIVGNSVLAASFEFAEVFEAAQEKCGAEPVFIPVVEHRDRPITIRQRYR